MFDLIGSDHFLSGGSYILSVILTVAFVLWCLIIERYWYFFFGRKQAAEAVRRQWRQVQDTRSRRAYKIRLYYISKFRQQASVRLSMIKTLINISMLLGLLGTITGMVQVFEVVSMLEAHNVRQMASGVSRTVIPAMAGLVVALSGLYFSAQLQRRARLEVRKLADTLEV